MPGDPQPVVETLSGPVLGSTSNYDAMLHFRGIPYAHPPCGADRFRSPQPHEPWRKVLRATHHGAAAPQLEATVELMRDPSLTEFSDDCLTLNIATPACDGKRRPVLFWIHGGAFTTGSGGSGLYRSGSLAAAGDSVLVTINYRLGPLGFLRLDEATDGALPSSGTEGLQDQVAALRWVKSNIEAFGGDANNICLFGESAGGMCVASLLAMPAARGLFRRAIIQSGGGDVALPKQRGIAMGEALVRHLKEAGHSAADLPSLPSQTLVEAAARLRHPKMVDRTAIMGMATVPVIDGEHLPMAPIEAIRQGQNADVDLLVGWTRDEWNMFTVFDPNQWQLDEMRMYTLMDKLAGDADKARQLIPAYQDMLAKRRRPAHPGAVFSQAMTDYAFRIPSLDILRARQGATGDTRAYCFCWESPLADGVLGACHALELPFLFGTLHPKSMRAWAGEGPAVRQLSAQIQRCWCEFARSGRMQLDGEVWPTWDSDTPMLGELGKQCGFAPLADKSGLQIWNA